MFLLLNCSIKTMVIVLSDLLLGCLSLTAVANYCASCKDASISEVTFSKQLTKASSGQTFVIQNNKTISSKSLRLFIRITIGHWTEKLLSQKNLCKFNKVATFSLISSSLIFP